jgi:hypothetical protein
VSALCDADSEFDRRAFAALVEAAEESYVNAALGDKTGLRLPEPLPLA